MGRRKIPAVAAPEPVAVPATGGRWPAPAVLVACVWIAFAPALGNGFVDYDDPGWILENPSFRGLGWDQVRFAFTTTTGGVYQPIGWLLQGLCYVLFGLEPWGYHLVSLLFHVANVVLLHRLCVRLVTRTMPGIAGRLGQRLAWFCVVPVGLYAVHPLRVEMVAWASPQAYLPSITFSLLATLAYLHAHPPGGGFRPRSMIVASVLVVLAVLSKGSAVVLPFVWLILDAYPLGRLGAGRPSWPSIRKALVEKAPILAICLAFATVAMVVKPLWVDPEETTEPVPLGRVAQAGFGACFYLAKTVWPFGITAFYPRPEGDDFHSPLFAACVAAVAIAVVLAFRMRRRWPWLPVTLAAYLVIVAPYLGLARVGLTLASDRYGHAPTMAWVVLGCAGICRLAQRRWSMPIRLGAGAGTLALACGLMFLCSSQCRVWGSNERLWRQALENAPGSSLLHDYLGATLAERGELEPAVAEFREALRIRPRFVHALCDLGAALDRLGESDRAIDYLQEAGRLDPSNVKVPVNLSSALLHRGRVDEAIALCRRALESKPDLPDFHLNLGLALLSQRKVDQAIAELDRALALRPRSAEAHAALGGAAVLRGRQDEAIAHYRQALELDPDQTDSRINLGLALARQRRSAEALDELHEAVRRDRGNAEAHHILAAVLVASGRVGEASAEFEEVLRLRPDHPQARAFMAMTRDHRR